MLGAEGVDDHPNPSHWKPAGPKTNRCLLSVAVARVSQVQYLRATLAWVADFTGCDPKTKTRALAVCCVWVGETVKK